MPGGVTSNRCPCAAPTASRVRAGSHGRLPDAFTLDAALFKSFRFERSRLTASLMLRNLTGEADTVYGGYESLRVRRIRPGDDTLYAPHASRCTYAWPRSFYLTISYRF